MIKEYLEERLKTLTEEIKKVSTHRDDRTQKRHTRDLAREICVDLEGRKREISNALMHIADCERNEIESIELNSKANFNIETNGEKY